MTLRGSMLALWILLPGAAMAQEIRIDGCAELARIVYDEVQSSVMRGPSGSGPWYINPGQGEIHVCRTASKTVSRAFSLAVQSAGVDFSWNDSGRWDDHCISRFLSHCFPDTAQRPDSIGPIWLKVSQAVMDEMHNPYSSDEVRFRADDLRLQLGLSLRTVSRN